MGVDATTIVGVVKIFQAAAQGVPYSTAKKFFTKERVNASITVSACELSIGQRFESQSGNKSQSTVHQEPLSRVLSKALLEQEAFTWRRNVYIGLSNGTSCKLRDVRVSHSLGRVVFRAQDGDIAESEDGDVILGDIPPGQFRYVTLDATERFDNVRGVASDEAIRARFRLYDADGNIYPLTPNVQDDEWVGKKLRRQFRKGLVTGLIVALAIVLGIWKMSSIVHALGSAFHWMGFLG